jgi:hypothetical protein
MAIPSSNDARVFYRCAFQRFEEAEVLNKAGKATGAVYLAGYGIECMLKALVLAAVSAGSRPAMLKSFRGGRGHDYEWLRSIYLMNGGDRFPRDVTQHFTLVNDWSTELRYVPRSMRDEDADAFLRSAAAIMSWADGRL